MRKGQFKASSEMYRTFKGEHFIQWASDRIESRAIAYRAAGIRCAISRGEVFVHYLDADKALAVDAETGRR